MTKTVYLVIGADKSVRAVTRLRLADDEVAIAVRLRFPDTWGRVLPGTIDITVPDFTPTAQLVEDGAAREGEQP